MFPFPFVGNRNTDYNYFYKLKEMEKHYPVELLPLTNRHSTLVANTKYVARSLMHRFPLSREVTTAHWFVTQNRRIPVSGRALDAADVIFTNGYLPRQANKTPIILEADFSPYGTGEFRKMVEKCLWVAKEFIAQVNVVIVRHPQSWQRFNELYPESAQKAVVIPYYLPSLEAISDESRARKWQESDRLKILFVGNQARRKGLVNLIEAYTLLKKRNLKITPQLTVVTNFYDGLVQLPDDVQVFSDLPHPEVLKLMRESHVYAQPTLYDSYGLAFLEAIANGCVLIYPNWNPAKEIWDGCGETVDVTSAEDIAASIEKIAISFDHYASISNYAHELFKTQYHHSVVGAKYFSVFESSAQRYQQ
ncbi:MAG: glycosyltransferase family 4 protein [Acidobacteria bacterium]|nr:glycosyltransferase family 4 protein [Acidobacteriota bacterium]